MDYERLWAPWRREYVTGAPSPPPLIEPRDWLPGADRGCFLCRAAAQYEDDAAARRQNLVLAVGAKTVTLLNRYPYNNGHLLVSPRRHVGELHELTSAEHLEIMHTLGRFTQLLERLMQCEGFNVGLNLRRAAGAGVPGHLHWHLVPRWIGDNNFLPVVGATRVISQSLESLWDAVTEQLQAETLP